MVSEVLIEEKVTKQKIEIAKEGIPRNRGCSQVVLFICHSTPKAYANGGAWV
ncbi:MAG: hypothetical protein FWC18_07040 [Cystobacterineae bacterium]|nr:hypothetical protein [Cystobacterineae bacterium]